MKLLHVIPDIHWLSWEDTVALESTDCIPRSITAATQNGIEIIFHCRKHALSALSESYVLVLGTGKTTFIRMLAGKLQPEDGGLYITSIYCSM